jgi:hypothetical protein
MVTKNEPLARVWGPPVERDRAGVQQVWHYRGWMPPCSNVPRGIMPRDTGTQVGWLAARQQSVTVVVAVIVFNAGTDPSRVSMIGASEVS